MDRIALDEQRHIAFGVKLLSDLAAGDPECRRAVADLLREVLPWTASVLVPPGWDLDYTRVFGFELEDIAKEGADSLETKLRSAGLPIEDLPGPPIFAYGSRPRRASATACGSYRAVCSARNGSPGGGPRDDDGAFEFCARASTSSTRRPSPGRSSGTSPTPSLGTWWSPTATPASSRAASSPTVTLRCRFEDWADVFAGRENALRLAAQRRLRPSGDFRWLWRARRMFPR